MYEMVEKAGNQMKVRDTYALKQLGGQQKQKPLVEDVRVCTKSVSVMQLQPAQNQAVIQMAPYEDLVKNLQDRADMQNLIGLLNTYIMHKNVYEENRRSTDANRKKELAVLLSEAFNVSYAANVINGKLEDNPENKTLKETLRALGKFVHVELSQDEIMSLDDLSDILHMVREAQKDAEGQKIRELGLLAVNDHQEEDHSPHFVLMINGGESANGTGGSVTAPGGNTPVFNENWRDVRFIAHTHPVGFDPITGQELQTSSEFQKDVAAAREEEIRYGGLKRAEMVRRDPNGEQKGATVFYTGDRVLNNSNSRDVYLEGFEVRSDLSIKLLEDLDYKKEVTELLSAEQEAFHHQLAEQEAFDKEFIEEINAKIQGREEIVAKLQTSLSAEDFIQTEKDLAKFSTDYPEAFKKRDLNNAYKKKFQIRFPEIANRLDEKEAQAQEWRQGVLAKLKAREEDEILEGSGQEIDIGDLF